MPKHYSQEGNQNLTAVDQAGNFTSWMYEQINPHLQGNILEIGSGLGTYSKKILRDFPRGKIFLSDVDPTYIETLKNNFGWEANVKVIGLDLENGSDFAAIDTPIDSAVALNVLEHIRDDVRALSHVHEVLRPGGRFVLLVPAHKFLYNRMDEAVGHFRRYTKKELIQKASDSGFTIRDLFYFNFASLFGWYVNGNILKKGTVAEGVLGFFDKMVPILRFCERKLLRKKMGISLIAVLEKN